MSGRATLLRVLIALTALAAFACSSKPAVVEAEPAAPSAAPVTSTQPSAVLGMVRVNSGAVNVRRDPTTSSEVIAQVKKGERLTLIATTADWSKVTLPDGATGWVASRLVTREGTPAPARRPRRGNCPADAEFRFITPPTPRFSDAPNHGLVVVEVTVEASGKVTAARVLSNTTGSEALAAIATDEIRSSTFAPPIRNCLPKPFIYTYKRSF